MRPLGALAAFDDKTKPAASFVARSLTGVAAGRGSGSPSEDFYRKRRTGQERGAQRTRTQHNKTTCIDATTRTHRLAGGVLRFPSKDEPDRSLLASSSPRFAVAVARRRRFDPPASLLRSSGRCSSLLHSYYYREGSRAAAAVGGTMATAQLAWRSWYSVKLGRMGGGGARGGTDNSEESAAEGGERGGGRTAEKRRNRQEKRERESYLLRTTC